MIRLSFCCGAHATPVARSSRLPPRYRSLLPAISRLSRGIPQVQFRDLSQNHNIEGGDSKKILKVLNEKKSRVIHSPYLYPIFTDTKTHGGEDEELHDVPDAAPPGGVPRGRLCSNGDRHYPLQNHR